MGEQLPLRVDIRWLESFAVVAEERHFTRAAQRLNVSQPALSQHIARLERQLGVRLFDRSPGSVTLTAAGEALWRDTQPAMDHLRAGIDAAQAVRDGSPPVLRISHLSSYGPDVLPTIAARLRDVEPLLSVELREASIEEQLDAVRRRVADVAMFHLDQDVEFDHAQMTVTNLAIAPRFVALPRSHPMADAETLTLAQLADEAWVMPAGGAHHSLQTTNMLAACRRQGFEPRISQRANSIETMLGLVASGFGVAPAPWSVALRPTASVHLVRLAGDPMRVVAAHLVDRSTPFTERFIEIATAVTAELLDEIEA